MLEHRSNGGLRHGGRKARQHTVDRAATPTSKRSGNLVHGGDHGERINHLIVNQRPHDVPVAVERKAVQLGLQIPPAV